jgi:hypothetical protein
MRNEEVALRTALAAARRATPATRNAILSSYFDTFRDPHVGFSAKVSDEEGASKIPPVEGSFRDVGGGRWQLTVPTFYAGHPAFESTTQAIAEARARFEAGVPRLVILDLRGNSGGSSVPADEILKLLWGPEAPAALATRRATASLWRVSPGVIQELTSKRERIARRHPTALAEFDRLLKDLVAAKRRGRPLLQVALPTQRSSSITRRPARVAIVTDDRCISACLDFMDRALEAPNVVHVGAPTGSDTECTEVARVAMPSGLGSFTIPMQKLVGCHRGPHMRYQPAVPIFTSEALSQWIEGSARF